MFIVSQAVNLRGRVVPKLPDNACGNFSTCAAAQIEAREEANATLEGFINLLHDSIKKIDNDKLIKPTGKDDAADLSKPLSELREMLMDSDRNFLFSSWSKFSFYEADFGWGTPIWRSTGKLPFRNLVIIMDDQESDGVEAWVCLDEENMLILAQDANVKAYAI